MSDDEVPRVDRHRILRPLGEYTMEYVPGVPLTEFCDDQRLGTRERLEVMVDICAAVHHARQRGILHRDSGR